MQRVVPQYTSQLCSACGQIVEQPLSIRRHDDDCGQLPDCSLILDRGHNAAINNTCQTESQTADSLLGEGTLQQAGGLLKPEIPNCGNITISRIYVGELSSFSLSIGEFGDMSASRLIFKCWRISVEV